MKRTFVLVLMMVLATGVSFAEMKMKGTILLAQQKRMVSQQIISTEELTAQKKAELNGTEWNIEIKPMGGKGRGESDVITFADDKVVSRNLKKLGFNPTSFTVRLQEDGTVTWETMQTSEDNGSAFWRGDILNSVMRGVLMRKDKRGNVTDYNFSSISSERIVSPAPAVVSQPIVEE